MFEAGLFVFFPLCIGDPPFDRAWKFLKGQRREVPILYDGVNQDVFGDERWEEAKSLRQREACESAPDDDHCEQVNDQSLMLVLVRV